jgi:molybdopterin/thiamine biosynthesis adenylyltransferase
MTLKKKQFENNLGIMSPDEWEKLAQTRILLVGLGGLGGHIAASLVRLGIRSMILVDFDRFELSNLNRQLFSSHATIGKFKTDVVQEELKKMNPGLELAVHRIPVEKLDPPVFDAVDLIIDAVDGIPTRLFLQNIATMHQKPLLHGAVGGWYGQIGLLLPGTSLLSEMYQDASEGIGSSLGSPTFTPAVVANLMVAEFVKYSLGRPQALVNQIMTIDLLNHEYRVVCRWPHQDTR